MDAETPHIDVRAVHIDDAPALHELDYSFETDRVYTLRVRDRLLAYDTSTQALDGAALAFELTVTSVDIPIYRDFREDGLTLADVECRLRAVEGGYVALADGKVAGGVLLNLDEPRRLARVEDLIVGRQYRRYGVGSLLLSCASDWARKRGCRAIVLETQSSNYPAIQFYLRNGLQIWSIHQHFYPPGPLEHEVAIIMGKKLWSAP
ncbi:MAG TPA: GNAT family N-acetyltransferase [Ktedonobacteraceae bacterium]|nr:GNAT family N-acetyltransferase [Ktedonobacteraceae bacterium]